MQFDAHPGVTILLGHSGAGKSTLLRCIAGLCNPEEGHISLENRIFFDSAQHIRIEPRQRNVGLVFQDLALFPHLTVRENVGYGLRRLKAAERAQRVDYIMDSFQIADLGKRFPREISGGEQQRVALARSLVTEPCVLLLDEPMSSLDAQTKSGIIDDLRGWNESRRIPMLYVTHNHEEVFALGEHVIALRRGKVIAKGAPLDVVPKARRETMVQFAGFENLLEAEITMIQEQYGTVTCRLTKVPLELDAPLTRVSVGAAVYIGIRAGEILLSSAQPKIAGACNVISGQIDRLAVLGSKVEVIVKCGVELRVHLPAALLGRLNWSSGDPVWLIIQPHFCHLINRRRFKIPHRLLLFVCNGNTAHSPLAEAICNAEMARRLKIPVAALRDAGVLAESAGLAATPGEPMNAEAKEALRRLGISIMEHRSQNLSKELVERAEIIFCITEQERRNVIKIFPEASQKTHCLSSNLHLEDSNENTPEAYFNFAQQIESLVHAQLEGVMASQNNKPVRISGKA
jgi:molybdate transport system ATP-binding protein